jgi:hypothetical protein
MQAELDAMGLPVPVAIAGVNAAGHESGNDLATDGRSLPWLQDDAASDVWGLWDVDFRDVVVLDPDNRVTAVYNLTSNDLGNPANYEALKARIVEAAGGP